MTEYINFEDTVTYKMARATTAYRNVLEKHMGQIGLHGGQVFILFELWRKDGMRQIDLARRLILKPPTVNKTVKALILAGLVTREELDNDGRARRIYLTDEGRDIRNRVNAQWIELEADYLSGLTETERLILPDLLGKLKNAYTGRKDADEDDE